MKIVSAHDSDWIVVATEKLKTGGIVIHPTDTAYGIAVDATNRTAINKVFAFKKRNCKPLIMVVKDIHQTHEYSRMNNIADQ